MGLPLINIKELDTWANQHPIIKGISPRWMVPSKISSTDIIILVCNISRETGLGLIGEDTLPPLKENEVAMELTLMDKLGLKINDAVEIQMNPKNLMNGLKLFSKFKDLSSDDEYQAESADEN
jgi:hypothetical protein